MGCFPTIARLAGVAQLVERLTCNEDVVGSTPVTGSIYMPIALVDVTNEAVGVFIPRLFLIFYGAQTLKKTWLGR